MRFLRFVLSADGGIGTPVEMTEVPGRVVISKESPDEETGPWIKGQIPEERAGPQTKGAGAEISEHGVKFSSIEKFILSR